MWSWSFLRSDTNESENWITICFFTRRSPFCFFFPQSKIEELVRLDRSNSNRIFMKLDVDKIEIKFHRFWSHFIEIWENRIVLSPRKKVKSTWKKKYIYVIANFSMALKPASWINLSLYIVVYNSYRVSRRYRVGIIVNEREGSSRPSKISERLDPCSVMLARKRPTSILLLLLVWYMVGEITGIPLTRRSLQGCFNGPRTRATCHTLGNTPTER